ncbi:hypothetical protein Pint_20897 [Pistacia integerrima]|uniref:Uncharacterized protein n=1 Tax=Pistacia integerrima TaxID=434235 RepID=A0ACC0X9V2_9ROSI|nr:hypothetical protein Pint_20897 [Pistacia integerrima]
MFKNEAFDFFFFGNLQYNFEGIYDMVKSVKLVAEVALYVHLRIGPYVCAEWNYEDFLFGCILYRQLSFKLITNHTRTEMQRFTTKIVGLFKHEKLYASQLSRRTHHFITVDVFS